MEALPVLKEYRAHRVSSFDRNGDNADFLSGVKGTVTLAEITGPGAITHIWFTINSPEQFHLRKLVLRMYWDGEESPSVESPVGDFFGLGHGAYYHYHSRPFAIGTSKGLNCFWFMPFSRSAKITLTNEGDEPVRSFYYYIDYRFYDEEHSNLLPEINSMGRFHAQYSQEMPTTEGKDYTILKASGRGHYVGCNLSIQLGSNGWWGEGDDKFYIDGETFPSLYGTGSEDYFCGAWCYGEAFDSLYFGCPLRGKHVKGELWNVYRYHIEDPIPFTESIRVDIEALYQNPPCDYSSVAYWYQVEPHVAFPPLPPVEERLPRVAAKQPVMTISGALEGENMKVLSHSKGDAVDVQDMTTFEGGWSGGAQLWLHGNNEGDFIEVEINLPEKGVYEIEGYFTKSFDYAIFDVLIDDNRINAYPINGYSLQTWHSGKIVLGRTELTKGLHKVKFIAVDKDPSSSSHMIGVDCMKFNKLEKDDLGRIIIDNLDTASSFRTEGAWNIGSGGEDYGTNVHWAEKGRGESRAFFTPDFPKSGNYSVFIWYGSDSNSDHATNAPLIIHHAKGEDVATINLKQNCGKWNYIGEYKFQKGRSGFVMISNNADGNVLADAVKFVKE
ncbi:DUF2961 domain-containing protein [Candidatus Sumerlaeota bacterium]|nr:DUF2961 domain-containing protein [Candidatus Sumerlaeota bacterium]